VNEESLMKSETRQSRRRLARGVDGEVVEDQREFKWCAICGVPPNFHLPHPITHRVTRYSDLDHQILSAEKSFRDDTSRVRVFRLAPLID
jgi:hypothetical protein